LLLLPSCTQISTHHTIYEHLILCYFLNMKLKFSHPHKKQVKCLSKYSYFEIDKGRQWMEWKLAKSSWVHPALNFFTNVILILWCSSHVFVYCYTLKRFITVLTLWRLFCLLLRRRVELCMYMSHHLSLDQTDYQRFIKTLFLLYCA
jgi:hypothetical protein